MRPEIKPPRISTLAQTRSLWSRDIPPQMLATKWRTKSPNMEKVRLFSAGIPFFWPIKKITKNRTSSLASSVESQFTALSTGFVSVEGGGAEKSKSANKSNVFSRSFCFSSSSATLAKSIVFCFVSSVLIGAAGKGGRGTALIGSAVSKSPKVRGQHFSGNHTIKRVPFRPTRRY